MNTCHCLVGACRVIRDNMLEISSGDKEEDEVFDERKWREEV